MCMTDKENVVKITPFHNWQMLQQNLQQHGHCYELQPCNTKLYFIMHKFYALNDLCQMICLAFNCYF